jgi:LPXTG-motif cell wall-anchored protein
VGRALASLDHLLDVFHDKALRPILLVGRTVAFAALLLIMAILAFVALMIGLTRLLNVYLFSAHEWLTYVVLGVALIGSGLVIWRRRRPVPLRK